VSSRLFAVGRRLSWCGRSPCRLGCSPSAEGRRVPIPGAMGRKIQQSRHDAVTQRAHRHDRHNRRRPTGGGCPFPEQWVAGRNDLGTTPSPNEPIVTTATIAAAQRAAGAHSRSNGSQDVTISARRRHPTSPSSRPPQSPPPNGRRVPIPGAMGRKIQQSRHDAVSLASASTPLSPSSTSRHPSDRSSETPPDHFRSTPATNANTTPTARGDRSPSDRSSGCTAASP